MPTLDIEKLKENCKVSGYSKESNTIKYFFEVISDFDDTMKANFLFFFSGSFKIPLDNFKETPLKIEKAGGLESLPVAHTCFFTIELPNYDDKFVLKEKLV